MSCPSRALAQPSVQFVWREGQVAAVPGVRESGMLVAVFWLCGDSTAKVHRIAHSLKQEMLRDVVAPSLFCSQMRDVVAKSLAACSMHALVMLSMQHEWLRRRWLRTNHGSTLAAAGVDAQVVLRFSTVERQQQVR